MRTVPFALVLTLLLASFPIPSLAVDGVIEINQTKALAGGVTPTDTAGFPVTLDASGSYVLTSDLDLSVAPTPENATGIQLNASNITLDLNGFSILGTTSCTGSTISCTPTGSGTGIISGSSTHSIRIFNGTVKGVGSTGISLGGDDNLIQDMQIVSNGGNGIFLHTGIVESCATRDNQFSGMVTNDFAVFRNNYAFNNGANGIGLPGRGVVIGNVSKENDGDGINTYSSTIKNNTSSLNSGDGIEVNGSANVIDNTVGNNTGYGIRATASRNAYKGNNIGYNTAGTVTGDLTETGSNLCNGSTTCP